MPLTQVYDALANGQIDAISMDHESIINFKRRFESARNVVLTRIHGAEQLRHVKAEELAEQDWFEQFQATAFI